MNTLVVLQSTLLVLLYPFHMQLKWGVLINTPILTVLGWGEMKDLGSQLRGLWRNGFVGELVILLSEKNLSCSSLTSVWERSELERVFSNWMMVFLSCDCSSSRLIVLNVITLDR